MLSTIVKTHTIQRFNGEPITITSSEYEKIMDTDSEFIKLEDSGITIKFSAISAIEPIDTSIVEQQHKDIKATNESIKKWEEVNIASSLEISESKRLAYEIAPELKGKKRAWECYSCKKWNPYIPSFNVYSGETQSSNKFICRFCSDQRLDVVDDIIDVFYK